MFEVLKAKARSCKAFRDTLIRTNTFLLVEGTSDSYWGCMVAPPYSESCEISYMKGNNQLGFTLMDLRRDLLNDRSHHFKYSSPTTDRSNSIIRLLSSSTASYCSTSFSTTRSSTTTSPVASPPRHQLATTTTAPVTSTTTAPIASPPRHQ